MSTDEACGVKGEVVAVVDDATVLVFDGRYGDEHYFVPIGVCKIVVGLRGFGVSCKPCLAFLGGMHDEAGYIAIFVAVVGVVIGSEQSISVVRPRWKVSSLMR